MPAVMQHNECADFWKRVSNWKTAVNDFNVSFWLGISDHQLPAHPVARLKMLIDLREDTPPYDWIMRYKISAAIKRECCRARMIKHGPLSRKYVP